MNYSQATKPAKILNLMTLEELTDKFYLTKEPDTRYYSSKAENNIERKVFYMGTSEINITPTVRFVSCIKNGKRKDSYQSFVIETKEKSTGIAVVMLKSEGGQVFYCDIRILPLNSLNDIVEVEADSKLLTVNLEKSKLVLKTDITITESNTGEALYSVHDVDVNAVSNLVTHAEIIELKRELEFQASKLIAHYFQEALNFLDIERKLVSELHTDKLKELLLANVIAGCLVLEIVGVSVIQDLNSDWKSGAAFIRYFI